MNTTIIHLNTDNKKAYCTQIISNGEQEIKNNYLCGQPALDAAALDEIHKRRKPATKARDIKFS